MNSENFQKYAEAAFRRVPLTVDEPAINRLGFTVSEMLLGGGITFVLCAILWKIYPVLMLPGLFTAIPILRFLKRVRLTETRGYLQHKAWVRGLPHGFQRSPVPQLLFLESSQRRFDP